MTDSKDKKSPKFISPEDFKRLFAALQSLYPKTFPKDNVLPLKIGIYKEIIQDNNFSESPELLKKTLIVHTKSFRYLKSALKLKHRYDLNGQKVEPISESDLKFTKDLLNFKTNKTKHKNKIKDYIDKKPTLNQA